MLVQPRVGRAGNAGSRSALERRRDPGPRLDLGTRVLLRHGDLIEPGLCMGAGREGGHAGPGGQFARLRQPAERQRTAQPVGAERFAVLFPQQPGFGKLARRHGLADPLRETGELTGFARHPVYPRVSPMMDVCSAWNSSLMDSYCCCRLDSKASAWAI